ncbi:MAG: phage baseplate assembly protein V [Brevundimonas sp.]|uniref:phage baseplate assembly protein V n=1 Tax=Brevundimonas sp. TaxID=1871086 RepID=UPI00391BD8A4
MNRPTARDPGAADADRTIGDLLRVGLVESVDLEAGKAVVSFGDQVTPPSDWLMLVGDTTIWIPPTVGAQVLVLCPEGDVDQAIILNGLPSSSFAPLFLGLQNAIRFADGAQVAYDPASAELEVHTPGKVIVTAPAGVTITGDTTITGDVSISGDVAVAKTVTAATDVVGGGKSLKAHKHTGVTTGGGVTGAPQ